jgi:hypothetical protein
LPTFYGKLSGSLPGHGRKFESENTQWQAPVVEIIDYPRFGWRA